ncbi:MAG: LuxR C-terminal-related transcriptional regulator [Solirubrobacteraceae bacterium]|jgi:DNA-binding NarL/FixJ family response regulator
MPPHAPITVVLAHFDDLLAGGLRELIERDPSLAIVAADVEHRRIGVVLRAHHPDVAILDAGALGKPAEVRELSARYPATRLVLLGNDPAPVECAQLLAFGASACLGRSTQSRDVINAIHLASRGLQVLPRVSAGSGGGPGSGGPGAVVGAGLLSRRESEVLPLLKQGHSNAQIALALHVSVETVRTHARNIYRKLGVSSRRDLAAPPVPPTLPAPDSQSETPRPEHSPRRRTATPLGPRRGQGIRHS